MCLSGDHDIGRFLADGVLGYWVLGFVSSRSISVLLLRIVRGECGGCEVRNCRACSPLKILLLAGVFGSAFV
jgi:hypothetical protein